MYNTKNWVRSDCFILLYTHSIVFIIFRKFDVNIWSSFEIKGNPNMTLEGFINEVEVSL
jgi:hypothetical protein